MLDVRYVYPSVFKNVEHDFDVCLIHRPMFVSQAPSPIAQHSHFISPGAMQLHACWKPMQQGHHRSHDHTPFQMFRA